MIYSQAEHTFVICAYRESPYLEACIQSLMGQTVKSNILIATSTPNEHIRTLSDRYAIPLFVNPEQKGIAYDWNFAYSKAATPLITIAHQDDLYEPDYTQNIIRLANSRLNAMLIYTDYYEIRGGKPKPRNLLLFVKRIMNFPLRFSPMQSRRWLRCLILSFGCPICCPSVTFVRENVPQTPFDTRYKNSCDYMTWILLSKRDGLFVYCPWQLVGHRIYKESSTSANIQDHSRSMEDMEIMSEFWPRPVGRLLFRVYQNAQKSNKV